MTQLPRRFWAELGLAVFSAFLLLVTLVEADWIESCSASIRITATARSVADRDGAILGTVTFSTLARLEWRRAQEVTS